MTKFRYSDYLFQFRNNGRKCSRVVSRLRDDSWRGGGRRDGATEPEELDPVVCAVRTGNVTKVQDLSASSSHMLLRENREGWIPLHDAAYCGQTECLKILLRAHPGSVDKRTLQEQTALLLAVSNNHLPCVCVLLESGADPDICNNSKETPLYKACELQNMDMVNLLLKFAASVNQRCGRGWTALHEALSRGNTEICEMLIGSGAMLNPPYTQSVPPLIMAAQHGQIDAVCYLIDKGANVNIQMCDGVTALHEASKNGHREVVSLLLAKNADANISTNSGLLPLHSAAKCGDPEVVSLLVSVTSRARLRHSWITPLHLAAEHNRHAAATVLLRAGADVNAIVAPSRSVQYTDRRATPLYFAIASGSSSTAELLLNAGASLKLDPVNPLVMAIHQGCLRSVSLLLERGADLHTRIPASSTTFSPLVALCADNLALLKCLLNYGCDAYSCFTCTYGAAPHSLPNTVNVGTAHSGGFGLPNEGVRPLNCRQRSETKKQFCEWLSSPFMSRQAGPFVNLLLEHVGQVQLCSRLTELLDSKEEWQTVKRKTLSPRPLLHLCRLKIRTQMGRKRLRCIPDLPLPNRLIRFLNFND